jgi:hypothetical protein
MSYPEMAIEQYLRLLCERLPKNGLRWRACACQAADTIAEIEAARYRTRFLVSRLYSQMVKVSKYVNAHWEPEEVRLSVLGVGKEYLPASVVDGARAKRVKL